MEKRLALNVSINYFCNQKCFFCVDNDKEFLGFLKKDIDNQIYKTIDEGIGIYDNIVFTSGEPTLNRNFGDYIKYAKEKGFKNISMITNGSTLISAEVRQKILNSGLDEIVVSIHGLGSFHDIIIGVKGGFEKVIKGLNALINENNKLKISLSFVVNKQNFKLFYKYIEFFIKLGVNQIVVNFLRPEGYSKGKKFGSFFFKYSEFIKYVNKLSKEQIIFINNLILDRKIILTDLLPCVIKQSGLETIGLGKVELRTTKYKKDGEEIFDLIDDNNIGKSYLKTCNNCSYKNECEGVYIDYLENFGENGILAIK